MEGRGEARTRVLALLWHAPQQVIAAGGFRRAFEVLARTPEGFEVVALDDRPTFLGGLGTDRVRVLEFGIPRLLRALEARLFTFERLLEWVVATLAMSWHVLVMRLRGERFEVVYVPSSEQLPALIAGILAGWLFSARLVACNTNIDIFPGHARRLVARMHNTADRVIAISEHLAGELKAYGTRAPIVVNGVGLDVGGIGRARGCGVPEKRYDAVFVGRHDRTKGVFELLDIWGSVVSEREGATLLMIGACAPAVRARLESAILRLGIGGNVVLAGTVPDQEKFEMMSASRVCLFPSRVEEWGIVPQEALACGLPVVAFDLPAYRENISGCPGVFTLPVGDLEGMTRKMVELLGEEDLERFSQTGPEFVSRFGWDGVAEVEFEILAGAGPT
ncbi:MAG: glycosyltransferase family 4 protein [Actinobacteria bacterium]|nr:glycosyltransferase family 4 protein [Actinomycetota bacterium]MBU1943443.1 glycosyltransferase family 4 protein [Actinomycetota bacterium]MBU2686800.1 glycosyltransferase family 4 protein [Actinomycetota bacterium]